MQNLRFSAVFGIMMLMLQGLFAQYEGQVDFNPADVNVEQTGGWYVATIEGCYMETDVGKPYLPVKHLHIAIPEDKKVAGIEIINIQRQELSGTYDIMPTQPGQIPGEPEPDFVNPDTSVYNVNEIYPAEYIFSPTAGFRAGVHIAGVLYYPLTYNPVTKKLYLATHIEYKLLYADENNNPVKPRRMLNTSYIRLKEDIKLSIENPNDVDTYFQLEKTDDFTGTSFAPDEFPNFNGQAVEFVIITNQNLAQGFQEIADWKTRKGVPAVVRTVEWIYANYPGVDHAEKVRNFIIDAFQNWGAQYFMLGGDSEQVPIRYAWISHWNNNDLKPIIPNGDFISADMYFACLDGNWNADGDATFGEANWDRHNDGTFEEVFPSSINIDDVDREPDVVVGRVPVEDYTDENGEFVELNRYKTKFFEYIKTSQGNENNVLLFSQDENNIFHYDMDNYVAPQFPNNVNITKLYQTNGYTNNDVLNAFNSTDNIKKHIICGFGHGGSTNFNACEGALTRNDMDNLTNPDKGEILYLNSCKTMGWQYNTVTEHFINSNNGGVAVIGYSTFGWTNGPQLYNGPFINNIYNLNNHIGINFNNVKELYFNSEYKDGIKRMDFFSLSLAADPEMPVWTDSPDPQNPLIVNVPSGVVTGQQTIQVSIDNLSAGTEGVICLYKTGEVYAREPVTGTGNTVTANLDCTPDTPGDILVTVTAKNYLPVETSIPVTANPGIHLYISEHTISGDENIDAGETINLGIELSNSGLTNANGVNATLSCQDNYITITNNNSAFGNIAAGSSGWNQNDFVFTVAPTLDEDKTVTFNLEIHDADGNVFNENLLLEIKSPKLQQSNRTIKSTSSGDLIVEAGETVNFDMDLFNNSHSLLQNVNAVLSSQSPYVENILQNNGNYGNIASYETNTNTNEYSFKVSANYPGEPEPIVFSLDATNNFGQQWHFDFDLLDKPDISDVVIDFRGKLTSITLFWTVYENVLGYNIYRSNTIDGEYEKLNTQILPIAYFEDDGLEQLTTYYYKVSAISPTGNESNLSQPKKAWTSLAYHPDWLPITVSNEEHGDFWGAPNVYDVDNDGKKEIFITSGRGDHGGNVGTVFGFKEDGEELYDIDQNPTTVSGFAKTGISMTCSPAIGDIDNDGIDEIVVATRMGDPDGADKHKLLVYKNEDANGDGKPDLMWEKQIAYKNFNGVVLSDLNDNGMLEIIVPNQFGNKLEIFDYQGNNYPGWPQTTGENPVDKKAVSMPVAVDLDNDGNKEIVIGYEGGIYIWNSDGTDYLGQNPININIPSDGRLDCPVIAADIDNDGYYEILFMSIRNKTGYIYAIKSNGDLVTGWDNDNHSIELSIQSQTWAWPPSFVCGDVDMDGNIEVVVADAGTLKVWDNIGNLVLDKNISTLQCQYLQPLIADIDGTDNECEIIIPSNTGVIYAFKLNGDPVLGWPLYLGSTSSVPLIDDIDNDSKNEIIAASGSDIYVWDTKGYSYKNQWDRFRLNSYNNAVYENICNYNTTPLVVNTDETWNSVRRINSNVIVDNATLTINSLISFVSDAKIIVKPGAKLILNGATLTNACSGPWQGIQVWGDKNHSQYPDANGNYYQGYLEIKNGTVIENAICAVDLWKPEDWSSTGGIVYADSATFRNNAKSVHALYYKNYNPYDPTQEWEYSSNFKNCTFEITADYPGTETFYKHVDLSHVKGIDFQYCDFSVADNVNGVATYNNAIAGYDAQFRVSALCSSHIAPCPEADLEKCTFTGFYHAVSALNDGGSPVTFYVSNAEFINNAYGVKTRSVNNATVLFSNFEIGQLWGCGAGINSDNVTGFAFEENGFSKYAGGPQAKYFGIIINNSHAVNEVYKNNFTGLSFANFADGKNWIDDDRYQGLTYTCNQNSNNYADFYVNESKPSGIQSLQGGNNNPTGNTFTQNGATWHFYNGGEHLVQYFYNQNASNEIPEYPDKVHYVAITPVNDQNGCLSHYGNDIRVVLTASQKTDAEQTYYDNLSDYNSVKALYDSYIDGGSTSDEKLDIETAQPDDMWALRAQLLGDSPHLSFEVLKEAADKTDVFTESALFDILAANPDELKKDTLISYLENKEQPLPDYMIDLLKQLAEGTTYKTALQEQMAGYKHDYTKAALDIVRSILNDTVSNDTLLRNWLDNLGGIASDRQIIASYVNEGNFTDALALANMLPSLYDLHGNDSIEHLYFMDLLYLQDTLYQQGRNTYQLDSAEKALVENIAANSKDVAGSYAKSILEAVYNEYYPDCPDVGGTESYKHSNVINSETLGKVYGLDITVKPNPAGQWAAFDYTLPLEETIGTITITNSNGVIVKTLQVSGHQGQKLLDTRKLPSGMYLYSIKTGRYTKTGKMLIIK